MFSVTDQHLTDADRRMARYRRTFDPRDLWPETDPADHAAAYRDLRAALGAILAGQNAELRTARAGARAFGIAALMSGMGPLLAHWIDQGRISAEAAVAGVLRDHLRHAGRIRARLEQALARLIPALRTAQVSPVVLKGIHTGHCYFPHPATRPIGDIDLLVNPGDTDAAARILSSQGYRLVDAHLSPIREDWAPAGHRALQSVEMAHEDNPWTIDLHHTLDRAFAAGLVTGFGVPVPHMLESWDGPVGTVSVLRQPWLTAHLALNTAADFPDIPLVRVLELLWVVQQDLAAGRFRWDELAGVLLESGSARFAYPAFELLERLAPGTMDPRVRAQLAGAATRRLRLAVRDIQDRLPHHARRSLRMRFIWAGSARQMIRMVLDFLFPVGPTVTWATRLRIWRRRLEKLVRGGYSWRGT